MASQEPVAPIAERVPKIETVHGEVCTDDYSWLRQKSDPKVAAYLRAENAYTDAVLAPTVQLQELLYEEILSHIEQSDEEVPSLYRDWLYYSRTEEGKQYPIYCRKQNSQGASEEITLDLNEMSKSVPFLSVAAYEVNDAGDILAYSTDTTGFREYKTQFKNLTSGEILPDTMERTGSVAWAADNKTVFYTVEDHAKRDYRVYKHRLGSDPASDELIYEETDELFRVGVSRTKSGGYLVITSASFTASEVRYLAAETPDKEWRLVSPRRSMHEYYVEHHGDHFVILTNDKGKNFRVVTAPLNDPVESEWKQLVPHRTEVMVESVLCFRDHLVLYEREGGLEHLRVFQASSSWDTGVRLEFPEPAYTLSPVSNNDFEAGFLRLNYQSMVTPPSTIDYDMNTHTPNLRKQVHVPGGFDPANYESFRVFAPAADGEQIPVAIVRLKGTQSGAPTLLSAYGAYGISSPARFSSAVLALLDRGVVFAVAQIRGGGDLGKRWHDEGRMMNKRNTFTDFIAASQYLISAGYSDPTKLNITGGSAGGLLMGAVTNMRPDLFNAVISLVPFVDVINTMLDESLPLTVGEFEEWGNPKIKSNYDYMRSYCPYSNLEAKAYPAILVKTSFNDSQVMYWEPAKYVAKLRTLKTDSRPLLLKTNMDGGHGGSSGRYDRIKEIALNYAFLLQQCGLT